MTFLGKLKKRDAYAATLYQVIKDHNQEEAIRITRLSHHRMVQQAVADETGVHLPTVDIRETANYSMKPVQLILTDKLDSTVAARLKNAFREIGFIKLDLKIIDKSRGMYNILHSSINFFRFFKSL